jgi:hypothetical protein
MAKRSIDCSTASTPRSSRRSSGATRPPAGEIAVEVSFAIDGERGSIDVLAFHSLAGVLAVNEVKSVMPDAQSTVHTLDRKSQLARRIVAERGWRPAVVSRFLVIGEDRTARRRVEQHSAMFGAAFPLAGRASLAYIDDPIGRAGAARPNLAPGSPGNAGMRMAEAAPDRASPHLASPAQRQEGPALRREGLGPRPTGPVVGVSGVSGLIFLSPLRVAGAKPPPGGRHRVRAAAHRT